MKKLLTILALLLTCYTNAQFTQLGDDIDGVSFGDFSGYTCVLSADGDRLCVGEIFNNEGTPTSTGGSNFGQIRCYEWNGTAWTPLGNDTNGEGSANHFGRGLAINDAGNRYVASAPSASIGYVRVYQLSGANWNLLGNEIFALNADNNFGSSIDMNAAGNIIAVGENNDDTNGSNSGRTVMYQLNGNTWQQLGNPILGINENDRSGSAVALSADGLTVAIGAPFDDSDPNNDDGAVRVYNYDGTNWNLIGATIYKPINTSGNFGSSVDINSSGNTVVIGDLDSFQDGQVISFTFNGTDWVQKGQILTQSVDESNRYGTSVSMDASGNTIVVGADGDSGADSGSITLFEYNNGTAMWNRIGNVIQAENTGQTQAQYFGFSTALSRDGLTAAAGDYYNQNEGDTFPIPKGSTRAFRRPFVVQEDPTAVCQNINVNLDASGQATITANQVDGGSFDDQSSVTLSIDISNFNCSNIGPNTVTLTVTDTDSNTSSCTATVTVVDNIAPTITCPTSQTATVNANCQFTLPDYRNLAVTSDNCTVTSITQDPAPGTIVNAGNTLITLTAFDTSSNTSCGFTLTVNDTIPPVANCVAPFTLSLDANGMASITAADINDNATDNCSIATTTIDITSFDCTNLGPNIVTLTVTDSSGLEDTCTTTVTIDDPLFSCNQAPVANCQAVIVSATENCEGNAVASDFDNGSFDPEGETVTLSVTPEGPYSVGVTNVTLFVSDGVLTSSCTTTITVNDDTPPALTCPGDQQEEASASCTFVLPDYTTDALATDNCNTLVLTQNPPAGTFINPGLTSIEITANDGTNSVSCSFNITITDVTTPVAVCQNITVQLDAMGIATITPADVDGGSTDNCAIITSSIDIDSFDCNNIGDNNVTLTVTDAAGLSSSCTAIVTIEDNLPPAIVCQNTTITLDESGLATITVTDVDGGTSDNCGLDTVSIDIDTFDCSNFGENTVTLTATDSNGNTITCEAIVTVVDTTPPVALCQNITLQLDAMGVATLSPSDVDNGSTDNCVNITTTLDIDTFDCTAIGENEVLFTVTDESGNSDTCLLIVTVEDITPPTMLCQDISIELDEDGLATLTPAQIDGGSTDNCGIVTYAIDIENLTCENVGENTVTLTATDTSGNSNSCTATVTVTPLEAAPIASCQNVTVVLGEDGIGTIIPQNLSSNDANEICGNLLTIDIDTFTCEDANTLIPVNLTVTNAFGASDSCIAQVFVVDNITPIITCPEEPLIIAALSPYPLPDFVIDGAVTITDNCQDQLIITQDPEVGTLVDEGETEITITVTDASGNSTSCEFEIFVDPTLGNSTSEILKNLKLFPNPTDNYFSISNSENLNIEEITILDSTGRKVKRFSVSEIEQNSYNVKDMASATYFVLIETDLGIHTMQLIKK